MNPVFAQFLKDNLAFVIIACIAAAGAIAAGVIMALTARKAKAGGGFFVGGKRLTVKYVLVALVLVVLLFGNYVLYSFSGTITLALCGSGVQVDEVAMNASSANSAALCVEIGEDGMTLLKNNGTLRWQRTTKRSTYSLERQRQRLRPPGRGQRRRHGYRHHDAVTRASASPASRSTRSWRKNTTR